MSDYQTEDGQPKYGVRLNPEELAVLREKQAREAEREREAKARRPAERRAKRHAAKRDLLPLRRSILGGPANANVSAKLKMRATLNMKAWPDPRG